jgi:ADP-ribose pyrophosphatase YjhB (NUDIX family)
MVEQNGRFLMIEERSSGKIVITQPGGPIEQGESPEQAIVREVLEESGCHVAVSGLLGVYLWINPQTRQQFLKVTYEAELLSYDADRELDEGIRAVHWYSPAQIKRRCRDVRTPIVLRCIDDYLAGHRQPQALLSDMLPLQRNVQAVMANAALV